MNISNEVINRIDYLFQQIDARKSFEGDVPTYKDMGDLREIKSLVFKQDYKDIDDIKYLIDVVRTLGEDFMQSIRIMSAVECYNYLAVLQTKLALSKEITFEERDVFAFDALEIFHVRNAYIYDDCEDLVELFTKIFDKDLVLSVLEEGKRKWLEGLKRDPIEYSETFENVIDEVQEVVLNKLQSDPTLNKWKLYKKEFKKRGIDWKSPGELNEGALFD